MTKKTFTDLPGWEFDADEISAGIYKASGRDTRGHHVDATGTDPERLIEQCVAAARELTPRIGRADKKTSL